MNFRLSCDFRSIPLIGSFDMFKVEHLINLEYTLSFAVDVPERRRVTSGNQIENQMSQPQSLKVDGFFFVESASFM